LASAGGMPLYMLDTNIETNNPYDQDITDRRRHGYADPPGNYAGHWWSTDAEGAGAKSNGVPHERGTLVLALDPYIDSGRGTEF